MKDSNGIIERLKDHYFWDVNIACLDGETSKRLIIERVFSLGDVKEMKAVIDYYSHLQVIDILSRVKYLDPKTLNFVSKLFDKPKKEFRCYTHQQSSTQLWNS